MNREQERNRLVELVRTASHELTSRCVGDCGDCADKIADYLLDNGVIVAPMPMADWLREELSEHVHKRCVEEL